MKHIRYFWCNFLW